MSVQITVKVNLEQLKKFHNVAKAIDNPLATTISAWSVGIHRQILMNLTGGKLNVVTGRLRSRQQFPVLTKAAGMITTSFENKTEYAAIHEFGGTTPAHIILPRTKKALSFLIGGKKVVVRSVNHPGSVIKEKRFIREPIDSGLKTLKVLMEAKMQKVLNVQ